MHKFVCACAAVYSAAVIYAAPVMLLLEYSTLVVTSYRKRRIAFIARVHYYFLIIRISIHQYSLSRCSLACAQIIPRHGGLHASLSHILEDIVVTLFLPIYFTNS